MKEWMVLNKPTAFKTLGHPLRLRLLRLLTERPASVKDLAEMLAMAHAKIYYHVKELEKNGLVEVVDTSTINGIIEKYYYAVAKTFFVGQSVGEYSALTERTQSVVAEEMLRWRRSEKLAVNYDVIAQQIISKGLQIGLDDKVVLEGSPSHQEFLEALAVQCRSNGAQAIIRTITTDYISKVLQSTTTEMLRREPPFSRLLYQQVDYWLSIDTIENTALLRQASSEKLAAWREGEITALKNAGQSFKSIVISWPNKTWAQERGLPHDLLHDTFWQALDVPVSTLTNTGEALQKKLLANNSVKLKDYSTESNLSFKIAKNRPILVNDGVLQQDCAEDFETDLRLPGGKLIVAPIEESINGQLLIPQVVYRGETFEKIELFISRGKIETQNPQTQTWLEKVLSTNKGGFMVGLISIGFNPAITQVCGYEGLDLITPRTVGIGVGANKHLGGNIASPLLPFYFTIPKMELVQE